MIDIDEIRDAHIRMSGLSKADQPYTFYHDETNNIKKLRLDAQGLNVAEPEEEKGKEEKGTGYLIRSRPASPVASRIARI